MLFKKVDKSLLLQGLWGLKWWGTRPKVLIAIPVFKESDLRDIIAAEIEKGGTPFFIVWKWVSLRRRLLIRERYELGCFTKVHIMHKPYCNVNENYEKYLSTLSYARLSGWFFPPQSKTVQGTFELMYRKLAVIDYIEILNKDLQWRSICTMCWKQIVKGWKTAYGCTSCSAKASLHEKWTQVTCTFMQSYDSRTSVSLISWRPVSIITESSFEFTVW